MSEQSLRRSSNVLRNLLVEGALGRAWRMAGQPKEPGIEAVDLATVLAGLRYEKILFASAGGGHSGSMSIAGVLLYGEAMPDAMVKERARPEPPTPVFPLSQFNASPGLVVRGEAITRREVVKYVANKLGGAHFDDRRTERAHILLDEVLSSMTVSDKRAPYFELLSIGQAVVASADVARLRRLIQ